MTTIWQGQDYIETIKAHRTEHGSSLVVARNAVDQGWRPTRSQPMTAQTGVEGAVERLEKDAAISAVYRKVGQKRAKVAVGQEDLLAILADRAELLARIATLEGEREKDGEAFLRISTWRRGCHAYDADMGHDPRPFGDEDFTLLEMTARARLAARQSREGADQ